MKIQLTLTLLLAGVVPAAADGKADSKAHVDKAMAFHGQGKFSEALAELEAAYASDPDPGLLYAMAQMQVKLDRCEAAIGNYEKFIASKPGDKPEKAAREAITACKTQLKTTPKPDATPAPKPDPTPDAPKPDPRPEPTPDPVREPKRTADIAPMPQPTEQPAPSHRAWFKDPLGGVLVGAGVAAGVASIVFYGKAKQDIDDAGTAENYGSSEDLVDRAASRRRLATIAGIGGGALVIGGVIRYVMVSGREQRSVAVVPTGGGAAVTFGGRW